MLANLSEYHLIVGYVSTKDHVLADFVSRYGVKYNRGEMTNYLIEDGLMQETGSLEVAKVEIPESAVISSQEVAAVRFRPKLLTHYGTRGGSSPRMPSIGALQMTRELGLSREEKVTEKVVAAMQRFSMCSDPWMRSMGHYLSKLMWCNFVL